MREEGRFDLRPGDSGKKALSDGADWFEPNKGTQAGKGVSRLLICGWCGESPELQVDSLPLSHLLLLLLTRFSRV